MRLFPVLCAILVLALLLTGANCIYAQAVSGSLLGTVTDASGGTVPNAKVTITEMKTGISRRMETNTSGNYAFPSLEPGTYKVTVEQSGFRTAVKEGVDVLVNTTIRADLVLQPGAVNEQVTVVAEVPILQTDRSDTGRKIEAVQVMNMPLGYSRNFQSLLNLVPGTSRAFQPHSEFFNSQGALTTQVNGVSRLGNNVQFEGVDNNHRTGLLTVLIPPIEALETVDVSTSNYEAELGRAGGAVTNIILKSGTNDLHGGVYWFHSNSHFYARDTFQPSKPVTTYNYYGFNIGGPIIKNRTFFFGDFLQVKDRRGDGYIITVPTPAFRAGDFSSQLSAAKPILIYDPTTGDRDKGTGRQPFPNNQIPDARISPITKKILGMVPTPNLGTGLTNNYASSTTRKKDSDSFDVKVDHMQTDKDRFSARYSLQRPVVTDPGRFGLAGGGGKGFAATGVNRTQSTAINYTRLFSATLIMDARVGLGRYSNVAENLDAGTKASENIGIKGVNLDRWTSGISSMNISGYANPLVGYSGSLPWNRAETNIDFVNTWTKILHNHTLKFGVDVRRLRDELLQTQDAGGPRGEFQFRNNQTSTPGAPVLDQANAMASFLLDVPSLFQRDLAVVFPAYRATMLFTYIQDKWQVTPKLTVDLGLRHDFYPPATPRLPGGFSNYDPGTNTLVVAGIGSNPMNLGRKTYYTGFAPRVGLAYRIDSKTVVRTGFGLSWIPFPDNKYAWDNFPVKQSNQYNSLGSYGQALSAPGVYGSMGTGFPAPQPAVIPQDGKIVASLTQNINSVIPLDYREGYIEAWNLALQRQLPKNFTIEAAYVANHTVRAPVGYNLNASMVFNSGASGRPLYQKFGKNSDATLRYAGYSNNYNSLQAKIDRRFSGGFLLTTAYTYGKAMGYSSEDGGLWNYIQVRRSYSRLDFDRTHTFIQSYVYELPFGKGKRWLQGGVGRWVLGEWQVNGVLNIMSGRPMTFGTNVAGNTPGTSLTPDQIGPIKVLHNIAGPGGTALWFDTSAFAQPLNADGKTPHFGNLGRNNFDGPGLTDVDLSLFRKFQFTERLKGEFRVETLNFTNTPAFGNPSTTVGSADFGRVTGTLAGLIANQSVGGTGPRSIQLGLKLSF